MTALHLGAAYYPEHWPASRWPQDIRWMQQAGFTVVRMGEFAWSSLEPAAGDFRLDWLEEVIALLAQAGIRTVLGTPSAAPPAWLVQAHPDLLAVDERGRRVQFGNRCHSCVNSPEMHAASAAIAGIMAQRFGADPNVIGWQIDNEYNRVCYCVRCQTLFQDFLQKQYGSLEALNSRWSTAYWSQTYSDWRQIPLPIGAHNPGLKLAFKHFVTHSYQRFQQTQIEALRPHLHPDAWITHNFMRWFGGFDHYEISRDLDLASLDTYVGSGHLDVIHSGSAMDLVRGFKRKNFWIMETQPGHVNWSPVNNSLDRGEGRALAWHSVAHGAEAVLYWQWRSALGGQEQYHGSLLDASGQPRPFFEEVQRLGEEFARLGPLLEGSQVKSQVALLNCFDSRLSIEWQPHHQDFDYVAHFKHYYLPLARRGVNLDVISANEPLQGYKLVIAPALIVLDERRVEQLKSFVQRGGHLVLTARTGMKDRHNALLPSRQPGPLGEIAGVEVEEYYALDEPVPVQGNWFSGVSRLWAERLRLLNAENSVVIARYGPSNGWLDGQPAISVHPCGTGLVYYVGAYLDEPAQQALLERMLSTLGIRTFQLPAGVEVRSRTTPAGMPVYFVINHTRQALSFPWPWEGVEHLGGGEVRGEMRLEGYEVRVITRLGV